MKHSSQPHTTLIHSFEDDVRPEARQTSVRTLETSLVNLVELHGKMPDRELEG